jgi:hypothetical protein
MNIAYVKEGRACRAEAIYGAVHRAGTDSTLARVVGHG